MSPRVADAAVGDHAARRVPAAPRRRSSMAVICGTPTPATMRVVQMEPGPMPTLTRVGARVDQRPRGLGGGDVAADHLRPAGSAS
jgi:hypothetical protein